MFLCFVVFTILLRNLEVEVLENLPKSFGTPRIIRIARITRNGGVQSAATAGATINASLVSGTDSQRRVRAAGPESFRHTLPARLSNRQHACLAHRPQVYVPTPSCNRSSESFNWRQF